MARQEGETVLAQCELLILKVSFRPPFLESWCGLLCLLNNLLIQRKFGALFEVVWGFDVREHLVKTFGCLICLLCYYRFHNTGQYSLGGWDFPSQRECPLSSLSPRIWWQALW